MLSMRSRAQLCNQRGCTFSCWKEALQFCRQAESQWIRSAHRLSLLSGGLQSCWPGFAGDRVWARHAVGARCSCLWGWTTPHHGVPGSLRWRDVGQFSCKPAAFPVCFVRQWPTVFPTSVRHCVHIAQLAMSLQIARDGYTHPWSLGRRAAVMHVYCLTWSSLLAIALPTAAASCLHGCICSVSLMCAGNFDSSELEILAWLLVLQVGLMRCNGRICRSVSLKCNRT